MTISEAKKAEVGLSNLWTVRRYVKSSPPATYSSNMYRNLLSWWVQNLVGGGEERREGERRGGRREEEGGGEVVKRERGQAVVVNVLLLH